MALGIGGVGVLAYGGASTSRVSAGHHLLGVVAILAGCIIWSFGSLYARRAQRAQSAVLNIWLQMFAGGVLLFLSSVLAGGAGFFQPLGLAPQVFFAPGAPGIY